MVAKPQSRKPVPVRSETAGKMDHRHEWVVDVATGRIARGECPACASETTAAADSQRE